MKIIFLVIGKTSEIYLEQGIKMYHDRLKHYIPFEYKIIPNLKITKNKTEAQQKQEEGKLILAQINDNDILILLDDKGRTFTSLGFSDFIENKIQQGTKSLVFLVGGAYGFSEDVYRRSQEKISLSSMTFSHQMVRLIFMEQIYRAMTIRKGEPYHHE